MNMITIPKNISPFKVVYYTFRFFGFMNQEGRPWSLIYTAYQWFILSTFGIISLIEIFVGDDLIGALSGFAIYSMTLTKILNFLFKEKEIRDILDRLENLRENLLKDEENMRIMEEASKHERRILTALSALVISTPALDFVRTTFEEYQVNFKTRSFYFSIWVPWSTEEVWPYLAKKILACVMAESVVAGNLTFAFLQFIFAYHISAYLKILKKYMEVKGPADEGIYQLHKSLLKLIKDYNDMFSGQMYYETIVAPILPCGWGLVAMRQMRRNGFIQLEAIQKIASATAPPFIVCSCGQKIITQVEELHEASYMSKWYEETPRIRKNLLMLMMRTMKPTTFNYRLFVTLNHQCLASVLQGIYSFFMFSIKFGMT